MVKKIEAWRVTIAPYMGLGGIRFRVMIHVPGDTEIRVIGAVGFGSTRAARKFADERVKLVRAPAAA